MQRIFYIIHGIVQGVGYRNFVRNVAKLNGVHGWVRNASDGSVHALAEGEEENIRAFEKEINVSQKYGVQVLKIERHDEGEPAFPKGERRHTDFLIEKTLD